MGVIVFLVSPALVFNPSLLPLAPERIYEYFLLLLVLLGVSTNLFVVLKYIFDKKAKWEDITKVSLVGLYSFVLFLGAVAMFVHWLFLFLVFLSVYLSIVFKNVAKRTSIALLTFSLLFYVWGFRSAFEENYCWKQMEKIPPEIRNQTVPAENETERFYADPISIGWKEHLNCHKNFNFRSALQDELGFWK